MFSLPGRIKNIHLPFVLNKDQYKKCGETYTSTTSGFTILDENNDSIDDSLQQLFSFKNSDTTQSNSVGKLQVYPKSYDDIITNDVSFKSLYGYSHVQDINIGHFLKYIPDIQIREFLPDTKLDQIINLFQQLIKFFKAGISDFSSVVKSMKEEQEEQKNNENKDASKTLDFSYISNLYDKLKTVSTSLISYLTGEKGHLYDCFSEASAALNPIKFNFSTGEKSVLKKYHNYIFNFPYLMWYGLQSCSTMNIYELPGIVQDNQMYSANGSPGWNSAGISIQAQLDKFLPGVSNRTILGTFISSILGNINVSFMPWWDGVSGNSTPSPNVTIKLNLFNDSIEAAINNFIFVNTLIPNARWMQYGFFQHSPCLYDIKLNGYKRLYACTGEFSVTQQGVLRTPSITFFERMINKHINPIVFGDTTTVETLEELIKIPDIYTVQMTFKSLLPDTFNNFIFQYVKNNNIKTDYFGPGKSRYKGAISNVFEKMANSLQNDTEATNKK